MIASLYQSGSVALLAFFTRRPRAGYCLWCGRCLVECSVIDLWRFEQEEDMCGHYVGTQGDVVAAIMPLVAGAGEEILYFEGCVVGNSETFEVKIDPASLLLSGIKIDGNKNPITSAGFAVADDVRVIDVVEVESAITLEGWVVAPDLIHLRDQRSQAGACRAVP